MTRDSRSDSVIAFRVVEGRGPAGCEVSSFGKGVPILGVEAGVYEKSASIEIGNPGGDPHQETKIIP